MNYNDKVLDGEAMKRTRLLMRGKDNDDDQAIFNVIVWYSLLLFLFNGRITNAVVVDVSVTKWGPDTTASVELKEEVEVKDRDKEEE